MLPFADDAKTDQTYIVLILLTPLFWEVRWLHS